MDEVLSDVFRQISPTNFSLGSMHWVHVTHINDPHNFYVRLTSLSKFLTDKICTNLAGELKKPERISQGDVVVYVNTNRQCEQYIRGKIIDIVGQEGTCLYDIFAIDHGFIDRKVKFENIWTSGSACLQVPPLSMCCELHHCQPVKDCAWMNKTIEAMKSYVGRERAKIIIKGKNNNKLTVELINTCPDDIATMLAITGFSTFGYDGPVVSRLGQPSPKKMFYPQKNLKVDNKLHVRVQFGKNLQEFFVAETCDFAKYLQHKQEISRNAKLSKALISEELTENMPVLVTLDHVNYERGLIKQVTVPETKALIDLVDVGKTMELSILNLKQISERLLLYPPISMRCSAVENQIWDNHFHKLLHLGNEFYITFKKLSNELEPHVVHISQH
ncbi:uncharacterized protein LOC119837585 [Zerene cesonia]|uniref:uncharacterized protein LOC119837585 n=1 Tax=Zerene cesonia TaxID=33412 RepID=UPI0018E4F6C9|nr:uncharacterized protein LOC119837585 [Zerene cesonia]